MPDMPDMASAWSAGHAGLVFAMWAVMMLAMMLPGAAPAIAALVVAGIGIYQLTPLKSACLRYCRSEAGRSVDGVGAGIRATIARGMQHGLHCVGCCWALMMLLFVGGVMNLPRHLVLPRAAGVALILFGTVARLGLAS
jgi:predicted metal-binding membrane protein